MNAPYFRLGITLALGALAMFVVLNTTFGLPGEPRLWLGVACLTAMMVAPLGVLMLLVMPHLFKRFAANLALYVGFTALFLGAYAESHSPGLAAQQAALHARLTQLAARS